ncbi:hypothetical protein ABBQ38_009838 [Trebouxia sp. C0009 RCD-2024]
MQSSAPSANLLCTVSNRGFGKCNADFMLAGNFCQATCGRCPSPAPTPARARASGGAASTCPCSDVKPPGSPYSCTQQRDFGKCGAGFMMGPGSPPGGFCQTTCGRCSCPTDGGCTDIPPGPPFIPCPQQAQYGKCGAAFMTSGPYCLRSCRRCNAQTPPTPSASPSAASSPPTSSASSPGSTSSPSSSPAQVAFLTLFACAAQLQAH